MRDLVPRPGTELGPRALEAQRLSYGTTREVPDPHFKDEEMNGQMHKFLTAFWIGLIIEIT